MLVRVACAPMTPAAPVVKIQVVTPLPASTSSLSVSEMEEPWSVIAGWCSRGAVNL